MSRAVTAWAAAVLLLGAAAGASSASAEAAAGAPTRWTIEREGIEIDLSLHPTDPADELELREGEDVLFRIRVRDTVTGEMIGGLYPGAWMARMADGETSDPASCVEKVQEFVGGSILSQPELNLNVYFVLALNDDATISVVDPLFGYGGTKLLAMPILPGQGEDWAISADTRKLFVSVPEAGQVVLVSGISWKSIDEVELAGRPSRMALQGDGRYLWVSVEEADGKPAGVAVIDTRDLTPVARIATGVGPHEIVVTPDNRTAFVANTGSGTVSVIDVPRLVKLRDLETGARPVSLAYSELAGAAYVSHEEAGTIAVIDGAEGTVRATIASRPGLGQIRFAPGGRYGFVVNPALDQVEIIDSSSDRIIQTGDVKDRPDQIAFSDRLAYIRHRDSEIVLMVPLDEIGEPGTAVPIVDFPGGQEPFGRGRLASRAASMVQAPGDDAMLIANPSDKVIYYYREGMAAPMGAFQNYERQPRGILVVDRSLQERGGRGVYETTAQLRRPGRYELAVYLDVPRVVHCFVTEVAPDPRLEAERLAMRPLQVEPMWAGGTTTAGRSVDISFRLRDPATGELRAGLPDVRILAHTGGNWQLRRPARETAPGVYTLTFAPPQPGNYILLVESPSGRLQYHQSPQVVVRVMADDGAADAGGGR